MTIVVGYGADARGGAALDLAADLARTTGDELVVVSVVQDGWETLRDFAGVDDEWRRQVRAQADEALAEARTRLGSDITASMRVRTSRSIPQALLEESRKRSARVLVAGSASSGPLGHIAFGSTNDRLAHSADTPVAIAPRGHRTSDGRIDRIVLAVDPTASDLDLARIVAETASWLGCRVEVVTFAVRSESRTAFAAFADQGIAAAWREIVRDHQHQVVERISDLAPEISVSAAGVAAGERWSLALDAYPWGNGDLLAVGSSRHGPVARVFIGSTATRIVHHCPVPVLLLPRPGKR